MNNNNKIYGLYDTPFTLRDILLTLTPLVLAGFLSYQHWYIMEQRKQIILLTTKLVDLTDSYETLMESVNSLQKSLISQDMEFLQLKQTINNIKTTPTNVSDVYSTGIQNIPYDFYVKILGISFCVVASTCIILWFTGNVSAPFVYVKSMMKGVAQKFGYLNDVSTYSHVYNSEYYWQVKIINNKDLLIGVKYPGSGEYENAFRLFSDLITASTNPGSLVASNAQSASSPTIELISSMSNIVNPVGTVALIPTEVGAFTVAAATTTTSAVLPTTSALVTTTTAATIAANNSTVITEVLNRLPF